MLRCRWPVLPNIIIILFAFSGICAQNETSASTRAVSNTAHLLKLLNNTLSNSTGFPKNFTDKVNQTERFSMMSTSPQNAAAPKTSFCNIKLENCPPFNEKICSNSKDPYNIKCQVSSKMNHSVLLKLAFFRRKIMLRKCSDEYSITCLKIDLNGWIDKLVTTKNFQILPGISLINSYNSTANETDMPLEVAHSLVRSNNTGLNSYLLEKIGNYVGSLSVRVNLLDNPLIQNMKEYSYKTFTQFFNPIEETGRSKKTGKQDMHAALWTAAMLAALGFSGLAALAGKAMLTGALALVLSLICLLRGCGRGVGAHYEIYTKPAHLPDVEHLGYSSALGGGPYSYARRLIKDNLMPALNLFEPADDYEDKESVREVIPITYPLPASYGPSSVIHHRR